MADPHAIKTSSYNGPPSPEPSDACDQFSSQPSLSTPEPQPRGHSSFQERRHRRASSHALKEDEIRRLRGNFPTLEKHNSNEEVWTKDLENDWRKFAQLCDHYSATCSRLSIKHSNYDSVCQLTTTFASAISTIFISMNFEDQWTKFFAMFLSAIMTVINSVQLKLSFGKKAASYSYSAFQLRKISREVNLELSKPVIYRWTNPFDMFVKAESELEEILSHVPDAPRLLTDQ